MTSLREWLGDLKAGIGWCHFALEQPERWVQPPSLCGATEGARLIWWFTPLCPKCKRLSAKDHRLTL